MSLKTVTLKGGLEMPLVGFGTWKLPTEDAESVKATVYEVLKVGYRRIDCSSGILNLKGVSEGIAQAVEEGLIQRSDLFLTSQLKDPRAEEVGSQVCAVLSQLQTTHLDLLLVHWPRDSISGGDVQSWSAMETVLAQGLVRAIGVSNLTIEKIGQMMPSVNVLPVVGMGEMHPLYRQNELLEYCKSEDIHWTAYSVFGSGEMGEPYDHARLSAHHNFLKSEPVLAVAIETNRTPAQVLIRWALQRGTSVTLHTTNGDRLKENLDVFDWELSAAQFELLSTIEPQTRMLTGNFLMVSDFGRPVTDKLRDKVWKCSAGRQMDL